MIINKILYYKNKIKKFQLIIVQPPFWMTNKKSSRVFPLVVFKLKPFFCLK